MLSEFDKYFLLNLIDCSLQNDSAACENHVDYIVLSWLLFKMQVQFHSNVYSTMYMYGTLR